MNAKSLFSSFLSLVMSRIEPIFLWSWLPIFGMMLGKRGLPPAGIAIRMLLGMFFLSFAVYIYNDMLDASQDKLNAIKGKRPLASDSVPETETRVWIILTTLVGFFLVLTVGFYSLALAALYYVLFFIYSYRRIYLKKYFIIKESVIALAIPITLLAGNLAVSDQVSPNALAAGMILGIFGFIVQPAINDEIDKNEDELHGVRTMAVVLSWKTRYRMFIFAFVLILVGLAGSILWLDFNRLLLVLGVPATVAVLVIFILNRSLPLEKPNTGRILVHVYFVILQLAFLFASF